MQEGVVGAVEELRHFEVGHRAGAENLEAPVGPAFDPVLAAVVRLSNRAAREGNRGGGSGDPAPAGDPEAWDIISGRIPELDEPARAGLLARFADAIASVPVPRL